MQEMNYLKRDEGSFQQLKTNNFLVYIQGPTKLTHNFTIYNTLNSSPIIPPDKKYYPRTCKTFSITDFITRF